MAKQKPQPATNQQFNHWIDPDLTIPVDDNTFLVNIPMHELQHFGTHNLTAYRKLPLFPFPKNVDPQAAIQE